MINLHPKMDENIINRFKKLEKYSNVTYIPYLNTLAPLIRSRCSNCRHNIFDDRIFITTKTGNYI